MLLYKFLKRIIVWLTLICISSSKLEYVLLQPFTRSIIRMKIQMERSHYGIWVVQESDSGMLKSKISLSWGSCSTIQVDGNLHLGLEIILVVLKAYYNTKKTKLFGQSNAFMQYSLLVLNLIASLHCQILHKYQ